MIIDRQRHFLIATPTKAGSKSWEGLAQRCGLELVRPGRHRMVVPKGAEHYTRCMLVRNPYDRIVSIYSMFATPYNNSQWGARRVFEDEMTFDEFVEWFAAEKSHADYDAAQSGNNTFRAPHLWTNSLCQNAELFKPDIILHLESPEISCRILEAEFNWKVLPEDIPHRHRSPARGTTPIEDWYVNAETLCTVNTIWADDDCRQFGYEKMEAKQWT